MPVNCSATANWLRKESLHTAGTVHCKLVLIGQFVHTEDCDNVTKFLVTLKYLLHTLCTLIMLLAYDKRVEDTRCGTHRIDSRIDTKLRNLTRKLGSRVKVGKCCCRCRVGQVVGRHKRFERM